MRQSVRIGELERQVFDLRMELMGVGSELRVLRGRLDRLERGVPGVRPEPWRPSFDPLRPKGGVSGASVGDVSFAEVQRAFVRGAWGVSGEGPSAASVSSGGVLPGFEVERQRQVAQAPLVDAMKPFPKPKVWS